MRDFTNPFRYIPEPSVEHAARLLMSRIESSEILSGMFSEGKMLGVLVVRDRSGKEFFISGFSGNAAGQSIIDGFVPPIYDLCYPDGHFKKEEREITLINDAVKAAESNGELEQMRSQIQKLCNEFDAAADEFKKEAAVHKKQREMIRTSGVSEEIISQITKEAQKEKADLKRLKVSYRTRIAELQDRLRCKEEDIALLKKERKERSDRLQEWIFKQYVVHNALGESASIFDIFASQGQVPPAGTGECAAPKLLEYAYRNGLRPVAMGEFWFGKSPGTAVRTHGHFYPSCTSKCGPLLGFMLKGLDIQQDKSTDEGYTTLYSDKHLTVVSKPSGMPSVPGLDGKISLAEILQRDLQRKIYPVHRLDMDTSGLMVYSFDKDVAENLQRQFENHSIEKEYIARLSPGRAVEAEGTINLPLGPDYDERPRQKVDRVNGKLSITRYKVLNINDDGTVDILFRPSTGRTHQLRVHSAHCSGLGRPIVGDLLYGGYGVQNCSSYCSCNESNRRNSEERLHLHARKLGFTHPVSGERLIFEDSGHCF